MPRFTLHPPPRRETLFRIRRFIFRLSGYCLSALSAVCLTSCARPMTELTLSHPARPSVALVHIAQHEGFFADEGLAVTLDQQVMGREGLRLLLEGSVDLAVIYEAPAILNACEGKKIRIHSMLHSSNRGTGIVARKDRGITRAEDLRGKRVGLPFRSNADLVLSLVLRFANVPRNQVAVADIPPRSLAESLGKGDVDAVVAWHPRIQDAMAAAGQSGASLFFSDIYTEHSLLISRDDGSVSPETMERLLRALRRASEYAQTHNDESIAIVQEQFPQNHQAVLESWNDYSFDIGLNRVLMDSLNRTVGWLREDGVTECEALQNVSTLIDSRALQKVDPTLVTIL